ncbi:MAG: hypothetical protein GXO75_08105 [Calditrichaeota bacterium]|nr:hypothetical protein [Calditrichota bacterium]
MSFYTAKTIIAGQPGTQKWQKKFGDSLVCVRYKYDVDEHRKIKTVELVVEDEPWQMDKERTPANKLIGLQVFYGETSLGRLVRAAGGRWNRKKKLWELPYREAVNLGLEERIVER